MIIVLDVEGMGTRRPYNVGYIVADKKGNIFQKRSIALTDCIWENLQNCLQAEEMTHKNIQEILADSTKDKYSYYTVEQAFATLLSDIEQYKIKEIWAYNCSFDKAALKRLFTENFQQIEEKVRFFDIIPAILHTRLLTKKYINFCRKNNFMTERGNIQVKAEIVYRYLFKDLTFKEEHTGLADCEIEYKILLEAIKTKKKLNKTTTPAWKVLKEFCTEKGI